MSDACTSGEGNKRSWAIEASSEAQGHEQGQRPVEEIFSVIIRTSFVAKSRLTQKYHINIFFDHLVKTLVFNARLELILKNIVLE